MPGRSGNIRGKCVVLHIHNLFEFRISVIKSQNGFRLIFRRKKNSTCGIGMRSASKKRFG